MALSREEITVRFDLTAKHNLQWLEDRLASGCSASERNALEAAKKELLEALVAVSTGQLLH